MSPAIRHFAALTAAAQLFLAGFFVQHLREFPQAGDDLRCFGEQGAGVLELAEFLLQLRDFVRWNGATTLSHDGFKSLEKSDVCA